MTNYKSCGNCSSEICSKVMLETGLATYLEMCWRPIHCPKCGGILSEVREHDGRKYRHCFACHMEVGNGNT